MSGPGLVLLIIVIDTKNPQFGYQSVKQSQTFGMGAEYIIMKLNLKHPTTLERKIKYADLEMDEITNNINHESWGYNDK